MHNQIEQPSTAFRSSRVEAAHVVLHEARFRLYGSPTLRQV